MNGSEANKKARRPKGYKPFWEKDEQEIPSEYEEKSPDEELVKELPQKSKFEIIEGLKKRGLKRVFEK